MLEKINNTMLFQGKLEKRHYFEGWYYKQVSKDERQVVSFIPGISLFKNDLHSFVQYIFVKLDENNKKTIQTGYIKYPIEAFKFRNDPFMIKVGENIFSETMASVKLVDDKINIKGILKLGSLAHIEKSILMPNIMGFFTYIPNMECYHSVISMNHSLSGKLKINDSEIDFNSGKGYIEKDWGTSFPKQYIWIECNNFKNKTISVFTSVANIPFMKKSFRGYLCNLSIEGKEYRFATYNKSVLKIDEVSSKGVKLFLENKLAILKIEAIVDKTGELIAPENGKMQKLIKEGLSGDVKISLFNKKTKITYEDVGCMAGIEIVNF